MHTDLAKSGVIFDQIFTAVCKHFDLNDFQVKRLIEEKRDHSNFRHIRYIILYLAITDLGYSQEKAGACIERDRKTASAAYLDVTNNPDKYAWNLQAVRKKYYPKTEVVSA